MKSNLKKIALVSTVAISFSLIAAFPASATDRTIGNIQTVANQTATVGVALSVPISSAATTFISADVDAACTINITPTSTGAAVGISAATFANTTVTGANATAGWTISAQASGVLRLAAATTFTNTTQTNTNNKVLGSLNFLPTAAGTYTITATVTNSGAGCTVSSGATRAFDIVVSERGLLSYVKNTSTVNVASAGAVTLATGQSGVTYTKNTPIDSTAVSALTVPSAAVIAFKVIAGNGGTWADSTEARVKVNGALRASTLACTIVTVTCTLANYTAPTAAGTYAIDLIMSGASTSFAVADVETLSLVLTVTAAPGWSQGATTVLSTGTTDEIPTTTTDALPKAAAKTLGTYVGTIVVSVKSATGAVYTGQGVTATVSGPGFVGGSSATYSGTAATFATNIGTADGTAVTTRSVTVADTTGYVAFAVWGDGTAGTSTIAISITDQVSSATTTIATKSFTFYGSVTALAVGTTTYTIGKAGSETGKSTGSRTLAGEVTNAGALNASTTTPAFVIKATDSAGRMASATSVPLVLSSDSAVASGGTCTEDLGNDADYSSGGKGYYNCSFTTAANAVSGGKAVLTFRIADPADATKYITTTANITVGGAIATETITFDKTSYAPGEAMVITRTAKDSAGNPVADGSAAPAVIFSKAVGGTAPGASTYVGGKKATSATAPSVFAPVIAGAFTANATSGNAAGSAITASASVTDANAGLLTQIDALNAKIVALNALIAKIMKKLGVK